MLPVSTALRPHPPPLPIHSGPIGAPFPGQRSETAPLVPVCVSLVVVAATSTSKRQMTRDGVSRKIIALKRPQARGAPAFHWLPRRLAKRELRRPPASWRQWSRRPSGRPGETIKRGATLRLLGGLLGREQIERTQV